MEELAMLAAFIHPNEDGQRRTWVKKRFEVARYDSLRETDIKYRIQDEDKETIKKYRK